MIEVIFVDFAKFASKRKITPECLAERFAGKIDRPGEFFDRVFKGQYAAVIIPYRSVVAFYSSELKCHQDAVGRVRVCTCGCGQPVSDRQKWAGASCSQRAGAEKDGVMKEPSGCLADKTANLSTRPSRIRKRGSNQIRHFPLGSYYCRARSVGQEPT